MIFPYLFIYIIKKVPSKVVSAALAHVGLDFVLSCECVASCDLSKKKEKNKKLA